MTRKKLNIATTIAGIFEPAFAGEIRTALLKLTPGGVMHPVCVTIIGHNRVKVH